MKRTLCITAACALCIPSAAYISACAPQEEERSIYTITAAYDGADTLTGSVELNYLNDTENALDCLKFNLWGNAFREGARHPAAEGLTSSSCGGMEITEVRGGTWSVGGGDENILEIVLGEPLYPDMRVSVGIDFKLDLAQADARTGVTEHTVNLGNFYPVLCAYGESGWLEYTYSQTGDPFVSETADYAVELDDLENKLQVLVKEKNKTLFLQADKNVPYGTVVDIMGRIKAVGIEKLGVVAEKPDEAPAAGRR